MAQPIQKKSHIWCLYARSFFIALLGRSLAGDTPINVKVECRAPNVKALVGESNAVKTTSRGLCK
jgi:hypothetical protein